MSAICPSVCRVTPTPGDGCSVYPGLYTRVILGHTPRVTLGHTTGVYRATGNEQHKKIEFPQKFSTKNIDKKNTQTHE